MSLKQDITTLLARDNSSLSKDAGQHFLIDEKALDGIVESAKLDSNDHVVEIGAGLGVLTKKLVEVANKVTAIEWDRRWIPLLQEYIAIDSLPKEKIEIINANALKVPLPNTPYKVVANIPYHITAPLLKYLLLKPELKPITVTILIQKEVAEKIVNKDSRGYLNVMVALFGTSKITRQVSAKSFLPPPKVESSVLHVTVHPKELAPTPVIERVLELASTAFKGKRKMIRTTIGKIPGIAERLSELEIDETRRPETITIDEWIAIGS